MDSRQSVAGATQQPKNPVLKQQQESTVHHHQIHEHRLRTSSSSGCQQTESQSAVTIFNHESQSHHLYHHQQNISQQNYPITSHYHQQEDDDLEAAQRIQRINQLIHQMRKQQQNGYSRQQHSIVSNQHKPSSSACQHQIIPSSSLDQHFSHYHHHPNIINCHHNQSRQHEFQQQPTTGDQHIQRQNIINSSHHNQHVVSCGHPNHQHLGHQLLLSGFQQTPSGASSQPPEVPVKLRHNNHHHHINHSIHGSQTNGSNNNHLDHHQSLNHRHNYHQGIAPTNRQDILMYDDESSRVIPPQFPQKPLSGHQLYHRSEPEVPLIRRELQDPPSVHYPCSSSSSNCPHHPPPPPKNLNPSIAVHEVLPEPSPESVSYDSHLETGWNARHHSPSCPHGMHHLSAGNPVVPIESSESTQHHHHESTFESQIENHDQQQVLYRRHVYNQPPHDMSTSCQHSHDHDVPETSSNRSGILFDVPSAGHAIHHQSLHQSHSSSGAVSIHQESGSHQPPPLPPKKKNVMAYMHLLESYHGPSDATLNMYRHSVHAYHHNRGKSFKHFRNTPQEVLDQQQQLVSHKISLDTALLAGFKDHFTLDHGSYHGSSSDNSSLSSGIDSNRSSATTTASVQQNLNQNQRQQQFAGIPSFDTVKRNQQLVKNESQVQSSSQVSPSSYHQKQDQGPPRLPPKTYPRKQQSIPESCLLSTSGQLQPPDAKSIVRRTSSPVVPSGQTARSTCQSGADCISCSSSLTSGFSSSRQSVDAGSSKSSSSNASNQAEVISIDSTSESSSTSDILGTSTTTLVASSLKDRRRDGILKHPLEDLDVTRFLIFKSPDEEGPEIKGGPPDALLVKATEVSKNGTNDHFMSLFPSFTVFWIKLMLLLT